MWSADQFDLSKDYFVRSDYCDYSLQRGVRVRVQKRPLWSE
jgi:hypothetical protein